MIQILIQCLQYKKRQLEDICVSSTLTAVAFYTFYDTVLIDAHKLLNYLPEVKI